MGGATTLTGGAGSDVFSIGVTPSSAVQINDFVAGQDKLDLHNLLANYHGSNPVADNWVQFQNSSTGVTVLVDVDGPTGSAGYVAVAKLAGVTSLSTSDWVFH
jgi:Ca2+-binding RTX toxin-like protein